MEKENKESLLLQSLTPAIDMAKIMEAANEYAMQGAKAALKDYYTGYNSPYIKAIREHLENEVPSFNLDLTGIMASLNEALVTIIDQVVNEAVAKSYIPLVRQLLTRSQQQVKVSDIVSKFIDTYQYLTEWDRDNYMAILHKDENYGWYKLLLSSEEDAVKFNITLHQISVEDKRYCVLDIPCDEELGDRAGRIKYTFTCDDGREVKMDMPYGYGILKNDFIRYIANLVTFQVPVVIDSFDLDEILNEYGR